MRLERAARKIKQQKQHTAELIMKAFATRGNSYGHCRAQAFAELRYFGRN